MKFAICNELYENWPIEKSFASMVKSGYQGVEIAPFTLGETVHEVTAARRKEICAAAKTAGIEIIGLHWLLLKPAGMSWVSSDKALREKTVAYFEALIDLCGDLGGKVMVLGSPKARQVMPGESWLDVWKRAVDVLGHLAAKAAAKKIVIALEPLTPKDNCNFINTAAEGSLLVQEVNSPGLKLHLDVKAMSGECRPVAETIRLEGGVNLAHFHANDPNLRGPGMGEMAFEPIAAALKDVKYNGWVSVEVFDFTPGAENTANQSIKTLKRVFG